MGKLYILMGKSASGKDTIYKKLLENEELSLVPYVGYTTRPIRSGETEGKEYFFTDEKKLEQFEREGRLIEKRVYHTVHGDWIYYSVDDGKLDLEKNDYLYIGTLESFVPLKAYYGGDRVVPLYVEVEDGLRLSRALERERKEKCPKYAELCRRFLGDTEDFSEEKIKAAGVVARYNNENLEACLGKIIETIKKGNTEDCESPCLPCAKGGGRR